MVLGSRHASGDVGKDEIIPAVERDEAVGCSEVDAYFPLILADLIADAEGGLRVSYAHGSLLLTEVCKPYIDRTVRAIKRAFQTMSDVGRVSRASPVQTAMRNCTR